MNKTTRSPASEAAAALVALRWAKRVTRTCEVCGATFEGDSTQRYCSPRHKRVAGARRWRAAHKGEPKRRKAPERASAQTPYETH